MMTVCNTKSNSGFEAGFVVVTFAGVYDGGEGGGRGSYGGGG